MSESLSLEQAPVVTVEVVEQSPLAKVLVSATLIRDLRGRIHLAIEFSPGLVRTADVSEALAVLQEQLACELGPYWGQVWQIEERAGPPSQALNRLIVNTRREWLSPPDTRLKWYRIERVFSKSSWLMSTAPPWSLDDRSPAVVSFYSYKGGVGQTLALAAVAVLMARAGHAVAVLDLNVEAPGVGPLLLGRKDTGAGIVDYMLERELGINGLGIEQILVNLYKDDLEGLEKPIRVFPAGRLTPTYLEKIARLDYEGFASDFAPSNPLARLLQEIRERDSDLEFFLLDVRAGLHDLGGFALNGFSHLNVLFGLDTEQSWSGYEIVLPLIGRKQSGERQELFFVHAMATPPRIDPYANQRFRERAYDILQKHYYGPDEDMPDLRNPDAPYGIPIFYREALLNVRHLAEALPEIVSPVSDYRRLANLIGVYLSRETL